MKLRNIFGAAALIAACAPAANAAAPTELHVAHYQGPWSERTAVVTPSANDAILSLNPETGLYEGNITWKTVDGSTYSWVKFYSGTGSDITFYGPSLNDRMYFALSMNSDTASTTGVTYSPVDQNANPSEIGAWYVRNYINNNSIAEVHITVDLDASPATANFTVVGEPWTVISSLYLMGISGASSETNMRLPMTQSTEEPAVFEITLDVPEVPAYEDSEDSWEGGFRFCLSTSASVSSSTLSFVPGPDENVIEFTQDLTSIEGVWRRYDMMLDTPYANQITPGRTKFTFNTETLEFTAQYLDMIVAPSEKTVLLAIEGEMENPFTLVKGTAQEFDADFEMVGQPIDLTFTATEFEFTFGEMASITLEPAEGYTVKVTSDVNSGGDTYMYDPDDFTIALFGGDFTINVEVVALPAPDPENPGDSGVEGIAAEESFTVTSLQGVMLLRGAPASALSELAPGVYIVNGRKVVL